MTMKRKPPATWLVDYGAARAHAIKWLGDRCLLAKPINVSRIASCPPASSLAGATSRERLPTSTAA